MKIKRTASAIATASILISSVLGVTLLDVSTQQMPAVAQSACNSIRFVNFSGKAASTGVNIRSAPSLSASIVRKSAPNETLNFDGWTYGDTVNDLWTNQPDARWYKLTGQNAWVASAVVVGNAPNSTPLCPNSGGNFYRNPEAFFQWAIGQKGIARLDTNELRGQCVSLIARYVQEVFLPANERTVRRTYGHGKDTASGLASNSPFNQYFGSYIRPSTSSNLPRRGAVISFPGPTTYGHVGIVMEARVFNGQRQIRMLESNWDNKAENSTVRIGPWINISGANGWTNPR